MLDMKDNLRRHYAKHIHNPESLPLKEIDLLVSTAIEYREEVLKVVESIDKAMVNYQDKGVALTKDFYGHNPLVRKNLIDEAYLDLAKPLYSLDVYYGAYEIIDSIHRDTDTQWLEELLRSSNREPRHFTDSDDYQLKFDSWLGE